MANARQCDRCGKFFIYDTHTPINISCKTYSGKCANIYLDDANCNIDLCDGCLNELKGWWIKIAHLSEANKKSKNSEEDK